MKLRRPGRATLGGEGEADERPMLEVWNKWDLLDPARREELGQLAEGDPEVVALSAVTGEGTERLLERLGELLTRGARLHRITLPASDGARIAWLHRHGEVVGESDAGEGAQGPERNIDVRLSEKDFGRFEALKVYQS